MTDPRIDEPAGRSMEILMTTQQRTYECTFDTARDSVPGAHDASGAVFVRAS